MIHDFYYRFYSLTKSNWLSVVLSVLARFVFFLRFLFKKFLLKKEELFVDQASAMIILQNTSPEPAQKPDYSMERQDAKTDLSIVVPVYNHIDVIERCIDSLIQQKTKYSYELLLVDDGSTDGAQDRIEKYSKFENVRIFHQKNGGIAAARNTGIYHSCGKFIMFVDCDDYVHEDLVESLMRQAEAEDADIVMCAHALVKVRDGDITSRLPIIDSQANLLGYSKGAEILNFAGLPWGKVYRRELFEHVRFFPGYWYEDTIIHSLVFTQCGRFVYLPEVKYEYQWHESNFSHVQGGSGQSKAVDRFWLLKAILERYDELGMRKNNCFYTMLLTHLSTYYYPKISSLPESIVQAMFIAGRELLLKYKPESKVKLPYMLRITEKAIIDKNIALWKLCSVNQ